MTESTARPAAPVLRQDTAERLSARVRVANLLAVVLPFLGLAAAFALLWGRGFGWVELGLLGGMYALTALGISPSASTGCLPTGPSRPAGRSSSPWPPSVRWPSRAPS